MSFTNIKSFNPHNSSLKWILLLTHFIDKATESQRKKYLAKGHPAMKLWKWDLRSKRLFSEFLL